MDVRSHYQEAGSSNDEDESAEASQLANAAENNGAGDETLPKKFNKYDLVTNSKLVELYVIDKDAYLKNMLTFTSDKSVANKYLDKLVKSPKTNNTILNKWVKNLINSISFNQF